MVHASREETSTLIEIDSLALTQGAFHVEGLSFRIPTGSYAVLMGKTGSGKTTVLEAIAGLRSIRKGTIRLHGIDVARLPPGERNVGYVPQDGALFRTMSVFDNLAFALRIRRWPEADVRSRVEVLSRWLQIEHLLARQAIGLSGGETQRIALGRALAFFPPVLLLDEPLSALDEDTRESMVQMLTHVREHGSSTVLHVTHNRREAELLGDLTLRMENGRLVESREKTVATEAKPG